MRDKLKAILHSSGRKRSPSLESADGVGQNSEPNSPRADQHSTSFGARVRAFSDASKGASPRSGRSRPLSSTHDDRPMSNASAPQRRSLDNHRPNPADSGNASIANDYRSYLPALSPVDDSHGDEYMTLGGDGRVITGDSHGRHEADVADRNIGRHRTSLEGGQGKALPPLPNTRTTHHDNTQYPERPRKQSTGAGTFGSPTSSVPAGASARNTIRVVGRDDATRGSHMDSNLPREEVSARAKNHLKNSNYPLRTARNEAQVERPGRLVSDNDSPRPPSNTVRRDGVVKPREEVAGVREAVTGGPRDMSSSHGTNSSKDWQSQQKLLLEGVVDLTNTVDTDRNTRWAPAVTHEVVKPHEHEVIQRKIYREIHNYSYYHRLQPVMHTEVLPPRHFIPNPDGEGLIEIDADELPSRTGKNRWWDIVQKHVQQPPVPETSSLRRTEPEILVGKPYMTDEGFERRETTILYPPTLADLTGYDGAVQPVHFDHKTGKRWMGELTTMDKLREQLQSAELRDTTPDMPSSPTIKRKPVNGATNLAVDGAANRTEDGTLNGASDSRVGMAF